MGEYVKKPLLAKQCKYCNKDFETKQDRKQFCSNLCYTNYNYNKNRDQQTRQCKNCDKEFIANRVDKMFCSKDCQWNYRYKTKRKIQTKLLCKKCGKEFVRGQSGQKYCSRSCRFSSASKDAYKRNKKWSAKQIRRENGTYASEHRYIIEQEVKRRLEEQETVHHIDLDKENNDVSNLHLFNNKRDHGYCHGSLNKIVKILLDKNIIGFDKNEGIYKFLE